MRTKEILPILANTSDGVFAVGTDHKIVFWSKSAKKILGYSAKEVLGKYCNEIIAGTDSNGNPVCSRSCDDPFLKQQCIIGMPDCSSETGCVFHPFWSKEKEKITNFLRVNTIDKIAKSRRKSRRA